MAANPKIIVVGGGLAGLAAVIKIAEMGGHVDLFSIVPVKRSHSVCAQGGINAAKNLKGEGDSTWQHFDDTVYGGDFLANQPPVKAMCDAAPAIIDLLDRMGVPFNRTPEGLLDFRRVCAMDLRSMEVRTFPADAVIVATGGIGAIFGKSTNSVVCTGSAQSALY